MSLQFLLTAFVVNVAQGRGVIYTLALGLGQGRRAALWAAPGCTFGIGPHLLVAALGVAALFHTSAVQFNVVKFAGLAYLLWLGGSALREGRALAVTGQAAAARDWLLASARVMRWLPRGFSDVVALPAGRLAMERA